MMPKTFSYVAFAAALAIAGPVLAQTPSSSDPPSSSSAKSVTGSDTAANAGASTDVASGMTVKDNTGASIGEVTGVKAGVATIKMGTDTFTVDTSKLAVQNGAATINATQADLKKMLPKK